MMPGDPKSVASREAAVALWAHESARVFQDRLVSTDDVAWFQGAQARFCLCQA